MKSSSFMKANSGSLGRINGVEGAFSKSLDLQDQLSNYLTNVNQEELVTPNLDFCNVLYVYPRLLNFSNQNSFPRVNTNI